MKKIIAFTSFLFLFLLAVLPANASYAATTSGAPVLSGISFTTDKGEIKATGSNNNYTLNLVGVPGDIQISKLQVTSATAWTLSIFEKNDPIYLNSPDDLDIRFANGVAYLDKAKLVNWASRVNGGADIPSDGTNNLMTVQELRDSAALIDSKSLSDLKSTADSNYEPKSPYHIVLYAVDKSGNESTANLTIVTEGWKLENGKWYDYNDQGTKNTGWLSYGGKWYFLDKKTGAMLSNTWVKDGAKWYFLNADGTMKTGWIYSGKKWYFLDKKSGAMVTNSWVLDGNKWYYMDANGVMKTGWIQLSKKWYYLYSDGHMAVNTKIGSYKIGKDGVWIH
ncbi:N-acetylmuramoyl-L-alanine amidase family protein [Neobacillus ginsengisoli]|uniref:N-acetylmuramoyl-L-alanine amidase family protein n=1 Tax=Neobacillus ginsengisoli TaxID=904295 RepID=A0ABT9Y1C3_9BACI|nr:hypothetical protein [Neobacillus ginsengisoli]MDQ0200952.1 hypothetical protein [Neobacillus ginsengisoli]